MMCPGMTKPPMAGTGVTKDSLRMVNWLLNTYYNPQVPGTLQNCTLSAGVDGATWEDGFLQNDTYTPAGTYPTPPGIITGEDMQSAVWTLTGGRICAC